MQVDEQPNVGRREDPNLTARVFLPAVPEKSYH